MQTLEFIPTGINAGRSVRDLQVTCGCGHTTDSEQSVRRTHGVPGQTVAPSSVDYIWCDILHR